MFEGSRKEWRCPTICERAKNISQNTKKEVTKMELMKKLEQVREVIGQAVSVQLLWNNKDDFIIQTVEAIQVQPAQEDDKGKKKSD